LSSTEQVSVPVRTRRNGLGVGRFLRGLAPPLLIAAFAAFAYQGLFDYDPYQGFEIVDDETESFFFSPQGGSPLLIGLVTGWLYFNRRYRIRRAFGSRASWLAATLLLGLGIPIFLWAHFVGAPDLLLISSVFTVLGAGALLGGRAGLRAVWLPAVFPLLLVPMPAVVLNFVVFQLQLFAAFCAETILSTFGMTIFQVGDQILTPGRIFQVIESCSGIRSIETLMMSGVLYAELFYRSRRQVALILISAPLIGLLVNQARVISLILNPYSEFATIHTAQGIAMLVGGVLLLAALDWVILRFVPGAAIPDRRPDPDPGPKRPVAVRFAALLGLLLALGISASLLQPYERTRPRAQLVSMIPAQLAGYQARGLPLDREFLGSVRVSQWMHRRYEKDEQWVEVLAAADNHSHRLGSLWSEKTEIPASGAVVLQEIPIRLSENGSSEQDSSLEGLEGSAIVYATREGRRLVVHWYEGLEPFWTEAWRGFLGLDQSPFQRHTRSLVIRLTTPIAEEESFEQAQARIDLLLPLVRKAIREQETPRA